MRNNNIESISMGIKLRDKRKAIGLTQADLAEKVDISTNFIGQVERGEKLPSLETLIALANALGLSIDNLLSDYLTIDISEEAMPYFTEKQIKVLGKVTDLIKNNF